MTLVYPNVVLFNGPPRSGKDTAAKYLAEMIQTPPGGFYPVTIRLASFLKQAVHRLYNASADADAFEDSKDQPNDLFLGLTPRQAYINVAEKLIKPVHGQTFFASQLVDQLQIIAEQAVRVYAGGRGLCTEIVLVPDLGFQLEIEYLVKHIPPEKITVVQVSRRGCSFEHDSREFVRVPTGAKIKWVQIDNSGTLDEFYQKIDLAFTNLFATESLNITDA